MKSIVDDLLRAIAAAVLVGTSAATLATGVVGCSSTPADEHDKSQLLRESSEAIVIQELFAGTVRSKSGELLNGATVSVNGTVATTDAAGYFELYAPRSTIYVIQASKSGYVTSSTRRGLSSVDVTLELVPAEVITINPSAPISVIDSAGTRIAINAGALVDRSGNVATGPLQLNIHTYRLREEAMIGDMSGVTTDGSIVALQSVGAFSAEFRDASGNLYNLAPGQLATVSVLADSENSYAATIDMWHFDQATGLWTQQGVGNVADGVATASVPHFSAWNFDVKKTDPACIRVTVDEDYLDELGGKLEIQVVVPAPWFRTQPGWITDAKKNVFYNLPPNTDVKVFMPPNTLYAVVNTGRPWGGTGIPDWKKVAGNTNYYPSCNGSLHVQNGTPQVATSTINGSIKLQGRSNHSGVIVKAWKGVNQVGDAAVTNESGAYSLNLPPDTYSVTAVKSGYLSTKKATVAAAAGSTTTLSSVTLPAGDVNGDNCVSWTGDLQVIGAAANPATSSNPGDIKDIDGNGTINNTDYAIALGNSGLCGPVAWP
ncbi:carboxypeptidase regulatory-like domain-containing protein [Sorangium sp. So ce1153]|uniref:carboxypeptidase regulatory-like domain-containing protein n=1 Tax=Sorangium sp. So ce1153 TaxID=3133333 RepID=UPI003F5DAD55